MIGGFDGYKKVLVAMPVEKWHLTFVLADFPAGPKDGVLPAAI